MLSFICSTAEARKLNEIYACATADAEKGKSVFILVPEQFSMYAESQLLDTLGLEAQNKIQILTFSRLCNLIFSKLGPLRTEYMDKAGKYIMTRKAIGMVRNDLRFFTRNINQHGFSGIIRSAISEFKRYGVSPDALEDASLKTDDPHLNAKLRDLALIYRQFNLLSEETHFDSEDNLSLIIPKIPSADFLKGSFYINFFKSFTPTEYAVITELMKKSDLTVGLSVDSLEDTTDVFSAQLNTRKRLCSIAEKNSIEVAQTLFVTDNRELPQDLRHLKDNFFAPVPLSFQGCPPSIRIYRPDNFYNEAVSCAQLIRSLLRKHNYSFNDILILTGNMENYELILPQVFEEYEISYFMDKKASITKSPLLRMIISVLEILAHGFSYARIMVIIRSGFFPIAREDADVLENYILAADITHSQWNTRNPWTYNPDPRIFDMDAVNRSKAAVLHPLLDLMDMFEGRKTAGEICENLFKWLNKMELHTAVSTRIEQFKTDGMHTEAEQLRLVFNSFAALTNRICQYMGGEYITFWEFRDIFTAACSELSVGMIPPTRDKVVISSVDTFRSIGSKAVIVLGALDGVFPRDYTTEGLLSDSERLILEESGLTLAPDTYTQQKEEQFLVYSVLTTATEQLHIYAPLSDRDGRSLKASEILDTMKSSVFPDMVFETESSADRHGLADSRECAFRHLASVLFEKGWDVSRLSRTQKIILEKLETDIHFAKRLAKLRNIYSAMGKPVRLSASMAKKLYGDHVVLSVSKLEKYNACAFSFFLQYGLYAKERLVGGLNSADTGTILHSVLCDYFQDKSENNADYKSISRDQCFAEISALVDKAGRDANENLYSESHYYKYMMLRLKSIASATAWKLIGFYSQSSFRPSGFEISFGEKCTYPPHKLDTQNGDVSLKGFIDRVDSAEINGTPYITITDYKSSERHLDAALAEAGIHFQPLVYANALKSHLPGTQVAGMFYLQMNDPILKLDDTPTPEDWEKGMNDNIKAHGRILDDPDVILGIDKSHGDKSAIHYFKCDKASLMEKQVFEDALAAADKKAAETADSILDGGIDINPARISGFDPCQYCPYGPVCLNK